MRVRLNSFPDLFLIYFFFISALTLFFQQRLYLDREDLRRIERLEIFDEFEEWILIQQHYALTVAVNKQEVRNAPFWREFEVQEFVEFV